MLPNFLVIGAPRSGTSWIHRNLMIHPQVFVPRMKEVHFFDANYEKGLEYYESVFAGRTDEIAVGETTPAYLHGAYSDNNIPALIKRDLPDVRLIASLRNPVERAYSRYLHAKARFDKNASLSFEEKLEDRPEFVKEGFYADQLSRYLDHFERDRILVLLYDELVSHPAEFMRKIYDFIGVDDSFNAGLDDTHINASVGKKRLAKSKFLWFVSKGLHYAGLYGHADKIRKANSVEVKPMSADTRNRLIEIYRPENERLAGLIGQDLSNWTT